jgi:hypothetical protein
LYSAAGAGGAATAAKAATIANAVSNRVVRISILPPIDL